MMSSRRYSPLTIITSLALAYALTVMPLPEILRLVRPNLVMLVMIHWLVRLPEAIGVGGAFFLGLVYDGVVGCPLGLHALSFVLVAAALLLLYTRWQMFSPVQQAVLIVAILLMEQVITAWGYGMVRRTELHGWVWVSALLGGMCWVGFSRMAFFSRH